MAIDFPNAPTEGQAYATGAGRAFIYQSSKWRQRAGYSVIESGSRAAAVGHTFLLPDGFQSFKFYVNDFWFTGSYGVALRFSVNGGSTFSTSYSYAGVKGGSNGTARYSNVEYGADQIHFTYVAVTPTNPNMHMGEFDIDPGGGHASVFWNVSNFQDTVGQVNQVGWGFTNDMNARVNAVRMMHSGGANNLTIGNFVLMGLR